MIISASRRSDIPRFLWPEFLSACARGFIDVANPFNRNQVSRVSLEPDDVDLFVFWTRDPRPILRSIRSGAFPMRNCYFLLTLTGYPGSLEPRQPPTADVIAAVVELAEIFSPAHIAWRYDPLLLSKHIDIAWHLRNFNHLAEQLSGQVHRVITAVMHAYAKLRKPLRLWQEATGDTILSPSNDHSAYRSLLAAMAEAAARHGLPIQGCCLPEAYQDAGIANGPCLDGNHFHQHLGIPAIPPKASHQRPLCQCCQSRDIGSYGTCPAGCVYCYAR